MDNVPKKGAFISLNFKIHKKRKLTISSSSSNRITSTKNQTQNPYVSSKQLFNNNNNESTNLKTLSSDQYKTPSMNKEYSSSNSSIRSLPQRKYKVTPHPKGNKSLSASIPTEDSSDLNSQPLNKSSYLNKTNNLQAPLNVYQTLSKNNEDDEDKDDENKDDENKDDEDKDDENKDDENKDYDVDVDINPHDNNVFVDNDDESSPTNEEKNEHNKTHFSIKPKKPQFSTPIPKKIVEESETEESSNKKISLNKNQVGETQQLVSNTNNQNVESMKETLNNQTTKSKETQSIKNVTNQSLKPNSQLNIQSVQSQDLNQEQANSIDQLNIKSTASKNTAPSVTSINTTKNETVDAELLELAEKIKGFNDPEIKLIVIDEKKDNFVFLKVVKENMDFFRRALQASTKYKSTGFEQTENQKNIVFVVKNTDSEKNIKDVILRELYSWFSKRIELKSRIETDYSPEITKIFYNIIKTEPHIKEMSKNEMILYLDKRVYAVGPYAENLNRIPPIKKRYQDTDLNYVKILHSNIDWMRLVHNFYQVHSIYEPREGVFAGNVFDVTYIMAALIYYKQKYDELCFSFKFELIHDKLGMWKEIDDTFDLYKEESRCRVTYDNKFFSIMSFDTDSIFKLYDKMAEKYGYLFGHYLEFTEDKFFEYNYINKFKNKFIIQKFPLIKDLRCDPYNNYVNFKTINSNQLRFFSKFVYEEIKRSVNSCNNEKIIKKFLEKYSIFNLYYYTSPNGTVFVGTADELKKLDKLDEFIATCTDQQEICFGFESYIDPKSFLSNLIDSKTKLDVSMKLEFLRLKFDYKLINNDKLIVFKIYENDRKSFENFFKSKICDFSIYSYSSVCLPELFDHFREFLGNHLKKEFLLFHISNYVLNVFTLFDLQNEYKERLIKEVEKEIVIDNELKIKYLIESLTLENEFKISYNRDELNETKKLRIKKPMYLYIELKYQIETFLNEFNSVEVKITNQGYNRILGEDETRKNLFEVKIMYECFDDGKVLVCGRHSVEKLLCLFTRMVSLSYQREQEKKLRGPGDY